MSVFEHIPQNVPLGRSRLLGLLGGAAAIAAVATCAVLAFGFDTGGSEAQPTVSAQPALVSSPIPVTGYLDGITSQPSVVAQPLVVSSPIPTTGYLDGITSRAPAVPAAAASDEYIRSIGALGWLQQNAAAREPRSGPTRAEILDSMSPQTRNYLAALMRLTPEQLAAGAAGSP